MRQRMLATGLAAVALAVAGCGGDDDSGDSTGGGGGGGDTAAAAAAPDHATVLACLKKAGLDAEDQSNSTGKSIGIDYPGGRTLVSFADSPEDADTLGSVAKNTGETVVVKGTLVLTIPVDAEAQTDQPKIEGCLS
jgi:hypothetical protein